MIKIWMCVFLMVAGISPVHAQQGCPYPTAIKYDDGYYQVTVRAPFWKSPRFDHRDFIDRFIGATFTPITEQRRENGYVDKCSYLTNTGQRVDLRYGRPEEIETMSLTNTEYWRPATDALDQPVYICQENQPDNCAFTVKRPKP